MSGEYWRRVHERALRQTRHALRIESRERVVVAVVVAAVSLVLIWTVGGPAEAWSELLAKFALTIAIFLLFPFIYIWKFVGAPGELDAAGKAERATLQSALDDKAKRRADVDQLATFRSDAINDLFNRVVYGDEQFERWNEDFARWCQTVGNYLKANFSKAQRLDFDRVGSMVATQYSQACNAQHNHLLSELAVKQGRLREMVNRFST